MAEPIKIIITQGETGNVGAKGTPTVSGYSGPSVRTGEMKFGGELDALNAQMRAENIAKAKKTLGKAAAVGGVVAGLTIQTINSSLDVMGDLTGDYVAKRRFNETMGIASTAIKVGGSMIGGALAFGPGGAAFAAGASYYALTIGAMTTIAKKTINIINTNMQADMLRGQSGNGNGSRGTHD